MIVPMKKATVAFTSDDTARVVHALQKCGQFMPVSEGDARIIKTGTEPSFKEEAGSALEAYVKFREKPGMLTPQPEYTLTEFEAERDEDKKNVIKATELTEQLESAETQLKRCIEAKKQLAPFLSLDIDARDTEGTRYTAMILGKIPYNEKSKDKQTLDTVCEKYNAEYIEFKSSGGEKYFYINVMREDEAEAKAELVSGGFEELALPYKSGLAVEENSRLSKKISQLTYLKASLAEKLEAEAKNAPSIELFYDREKAKSDRSEIPAQTTASSVVLKGWVRSDMTQTVEACIANVTDAYSMTFDDPTEDEIPPTVTKSNKFAEQYMTITDSFSYPGKEDVDPNPIMAPWYFVLYGMMMADVGYGALMAILLYVYKKVKKPHGNSLKMINLLWFSSITTIFFGALYGSYFGSPLLPPIWIDMQAGENIVTCMVTCIIIGALHLFTGMTVNAIQSIKSGHWADAVCDQFSWMLLITGLGVLFLNMTAGAVIAGTGAAIILFTGGRKKKGIFGKISGGLLALYGVTGFLSDLLSYTRIFALALSTGIIGMVMNMLAGMIMEAIPVPVINIIPAIFIYALGHALNLVLGMLGAYVHTSRLQYIEFFGKFYTGGGVPFRPLSINTKYVVINNQ